jgi:4-carboxymuconolactone decarboxylase
MGAMNRRLAAGLVLLCFPFSASAQSPPLVVLSSNATRAVLLQLEPALRQATARAIELRFANSAELRTRIQQGEQFDVAVLSAGAIDELVAKGKLIPASRRDVASAGVGIAIRAGATPPDISTPDALRKTLLAARSVAFVGQGATAPILRGLFDRFGIAAEMQAKTRLVPGAAEAVARGEAELGFTQISEILPVAGVTLAGPLPEPLQVFTRFTAAASANSRMPDLARALIAVMTSTSAAATIRAAGMQPVTAPDRLPPIPPSQMTEAQARAAAEFKVIRNGAEMTGPFFPLLRSPELMVRTSALGGYLRYRTALAPRLSEFAILLTAREWGQQYEWNAHYPLAMKAGVSAEVAGAIAEGRRPAGMAEDHEALYDFCDELLRTKAVSDATYQRALSRFGEQGVVDAVGIVGYYSMLAMVLNTARTPAGTSTAPLLPALPK